MEISYTKVWNIDGKLVVAKTLHEAISTYQSWYHKNSGFSVCCDADIHEIRQVDNGSYVKEYDAIIADQTIKQQ